MQTNEQQAFIKAYVDNVGDMPEDYVADFVRRYHAGENIPYGEGYTSILDAMGMWHAGIKYQLSQEQTA